MEFGTSWFYSWIDEFEIVTPTTFRKATDSPRVMARLEEIAHEAIAADQGTSISDLASFGAEDRLLAGRGYSLSLGSCGHLECLKREALDIASSSWPYFENVVVSGPDAYAVAHRVGHDPKKNRRDLISQLGAYTGLLNRIRESGTLRRFIFLPKAWDSHFCSECEQKFVGELGQRPEMHMEIRAAVVDELCRSAKIEIRKRGELWHSSVSHNLLEESRIIKTEKRLSRKSSQVNLRTDFHEILQGGDS